MPDIIPTTPFLGFHVEEGTILITTAELMGGTHEGEDVVCPAGSFGRVTDVKIVPDGVSITISVQAGQSAETGEDLWIVDVGRAVHRDQAVAAGREAELAEDGTGPGPFQIGEQRVDHDVADQMDLVISVSFGAKVGHTIRRRSEEKVAESIRHDSVDLLWHGPVAAPQTRLDVSDLDSELGRDQ